MCSIDRAMHIFDTRHQKAKYYPTAVHRFFVGALANIGNRSNKRSSKDNKGLKQQWVC